MALEERAGITWWAGGLGGGGHAGNTSNVVFLDAGAGYMWSLCGISNHTPVSCLLFCTVYFNPKKLGKKKN